MQPSSVSGNWLDFLLIAVFLFYAYEGYSSGFIRGAVDFLGFVLSFVLGLRFYGLIGSLFVSQFGLSHGFANALGFFVTAFLSEILIAVGLSAALRAVFTKNPIPKNIDRPLGIIPGLATSLVLLTFFLSLIISLPLSPYLKTIVANSKVASYLTAQSLGVEKALNKVFGGAVSEALNFLTVEPRSSERVNLHFTTDKFTTDPESEERMLALVNQERTVQGLKLLSADRKLTELARAHAKDMFTRGYFSHYTPEGLSPFDRMANADISFRFAGENLALAPSVDLSHRGLMASKGHRENILSPDFGRVGIGVIDGGIYGKMFVQEFTD